jgi:hypothetical protein
VKALSADCGETCYRVQVSEVPLCASGHGTIIDAVNCAFTVPGSALCSFFGGQEVRVILVDEPGVGKAEVAIVADYHVIQHLDLDYGVAIAQKFCRSGCPYDVTS